MDGVFDPHVFIDLELQLATLACSRHVDLRMSTDGEETLVETVPDLCPQLRWEGGCGVARLQGAQVANVSHGYVESVDRNESQSKL